MRYTRLKLWCLHHCHYADRAVALFFPLKHTHAQRKISLILSLQIPSMQHISKMASKIGSVLSLRYGCCTQQTVWILSSKQRLQFNFLSCQRCWSSNSIKFRIVLIDSAVSINRMCECKIQKEQFLKLKNTKRIQTICSLCNFVVRIFL